MEKKIMNSFGSIVIPSHIRKEMGLEGNTTLWVDTRELPNGDKEIVLRKYNDADELVEKYKRWAEVVSRISECSVSLVWNNSVMSMSSENKTELFNGCAHIHNLLSLQMRKVSSGGVVIKNPDKLPFLENGNGRVAAYFKINGTGDDNCFFVIVKGTKYDKKISKAEEFRRFEIIKDILEKV